LDPDQSSANDWNCQGAVLLEVTSVPSSALAARIPTQQAMAERKPMHRQMDSSCSLYPIDLVEIATSIVNA
jgi:hypothetical protein